MRKIIGCLVFVFMAVTARADIGTDIKKSLLDHVDTVSLFGIGRQSKGPTKLAMVDSVIRIGNYAGDSILDLQAGFFGDTKPVQGETQAVNWIYGAQLRIDPFLKNKLPVPPEWEFLKALEQGPSVFYNSTGKEWFYGYEMGLSFGLSPNK